MYTHVYIDMSFPLFSHVAGNGTLAMNSASILLRSSKSAGYVYGKNSRICNKRYWLYKSYRT